MHYDALEGKGNDKHCKVQSNYLRMHCSALDGQAKRSTAKFVATISEGVAMLVKANT